MSTESTEISVSRFKATCLRLLEDLRLTGGRLVITKHGRPIAHVVPAPEVDQRFAWLGSKRGEGRVVGDLLEPALDESEWGVLGE